MRLSVFTALWGTGARSSLTTLSQLEKKGEGTPPQSAESGAMGRGMWLWSEVLGSGA